MGRAVTGGEVHASLPAQIAYRARPCAAWSRRSSAASPAAARRRREAVGLGAPHRAGGTTAGRSTPTRSAGESSSHRPARPAARSVAAARTVKPTVTTRQLGKRYPWIITVNRTAFRLTVYKKLQRQRPTRSRWAAWAWRPRPGSTTSRTRRSTRPGTSPTAPGRASSPARRSPAGPDNPIKARWLGIFDGAGIHGTDELYSLGTAASHGCIRMAIPDVKQVYDEVPVGAPVYIA